MTDDDEVTQVTMSCPIDARGSRLCAEAVEGGTRISKCTPMRDGQPMPEGA